MTAVTSYEVTTAVYEVKLQGWNSIQNRSNTHLEKREDVSDEIVRKVNAHAFEVLRDEGLEGIIPDLTRLIVTSMDYDVPEADREYQIDMYLKAGAYFSIFGMRLNAEGIIDFDMGMEFHRA